MKKKHQHQQKPKVPGTQDVKDVRPSVTQILESAKPSDSKMFDDYRRMKKYLNLF